MSNHLFSVWDFMCLTKSLQREFTNIEVPWYPRKNPALANFLNEIALGEESDDLGTGNPFKAISHYDLYIKAMGDVDSDSLPGQHLVNQIIDGTHWKESLKNT